MFRFNLKTLLATFGLLAIVIALASQYWPFDINTLPPDSVLEQLDERFEKLDSTMSFDEALSVLGLARYKTHMRRKEWGDIYTAGFTRYYLGNDAYSLVLVEYYVDGRTVCILRTPRSADNLEAELATVEPLFDSELVP